MEEVDKFATREEWIEIINSLALSASHGQLITRELVEYTYLARRDGEADLVDALEKATEALTVGDQALAYAELLKATTPSNYGPKKGR